MRNVPLLIAATQALPAAAMLEPVYFVTPSTLPVQVEPERETSPTAAERAPGSASEAAVAASKATALRGWYFMWGGFWVRGWSISAPPARRPERQAEESSRPALRRRRGKGAVGK